MGNGSGKPSKKTAKIEKIDILDQLIYRYENKSLTILQDLAHRIVNKEVDIERDLAISGLIWLIRRGIDINVNNGEVLFYLITHGADWYKLPSLSIAINIWHEHNNSLINLAINNNPCALPRILLHSDMTITERQRTKLCCEIFKKRYQDLGSFKHFLEYLAITGHVNFLKKSLDQLPQFSENMCLLVDCSHPFRKVYCMIGITDDECNEIRDQINTLFSSHSIKIINRFPSSCTITSFTGFGVWFQINKPEDFFIHWSQLEYLIKKGKIPLKEAKIIAKSLRNQMEEMDSCDLDFLEISFDMVSELDKIISDREGPKREFGFKLFKNVSFADVDLVSNYKNTVSPNIR